MRGVTALKVNRYSMKPLTEKYRPARLDDLRGNATVIRCLKSFVSTPASKAFVFAGPPGCGKTSAAYAIARELGLDVEKREWSGLHEIASGEMTAEAVRELFKTTLRFSTWHGSGWKVVIANEADNMSDKASFIWLDILEHLPARVVVIFTTNDPEKLPRRFRERCEVYRFKTPIRTTPEAASDSEQAAQALIDDVWQAELGHNHSPRLADLDGWHEDGSLSFRAVLQALEPLIRAQRAEDEARAKKRSPLRGELPKSKLESEIVWRSGDSPSAPVPKLRIHISAAQLPAWQTGKAVAA